MAHFSPAIVFANPSNLYNSVIGADVNGDGLPDIVAGSDCNAGGSDRIWVLINLPYILIGGSPQQPLTKKGNGNFVVTVTITNTVTSRSARCK
jgi:FG-GAP repeat